MNRKKKHIKYDVHKFNDLYFTLQTHVKVLFDFVNLQQITSTLSRECVISKYQIERWRASRIEIINEG